MKGLRTRGSGGEASKHLSRLNLATRGVTLVRSTGHQAPRPMGMPHADEGDLIDTSDEKLEGASRRLVNGAGRAAAKSSKHAIGKAGRQIAATLKKQTTPLGKEGIRLASAVAPTSPSQGAAATASAARTMTGRAAAQGVIQGGHKTAAAVKGGIIASTRRAAAQRATKKTVSSVTKGSVRAGGQITAAATRQAAQAGAWIIRAVAALVSALGSTPALIVGVTAVALAAALIAVLSIIPGIGQQAQTAEPNSGAFTISDDYPFKDRAVDTVNPISRYYYGNCTDFVWWRVNRDAGVTAEQARSGHVKYTWGDLTPQGGNGAQWGNSGNLAGWNTTRDVVPGDIISVKHQGPLGSTTAMPGHVSYVAQVADDGSVTTENYGNGHYYVIKTSNSEIDRWIDQGWVVAKHNPAGRIGGLPDGDANGDAKAYARQAVTDDDQYQCLDHLWTGESNWNPSAENPDSGAYGIPQALPGNKMASAGSDWRTNPITQVKWGLTYISSRYGTPCTAWQQWQARSPHWY